MKKLLGYVVAYCRSVNYCIVAFSATLAATGVFLNYFFGVNQRIYATAEWMQYCCWFAIFFTAFALPYGFTALVEKKAFFRQKTFVLLLVAAPAIFAWKMSFDVSFSFTGNPLYNNYWNTIAYWPFKLLIVAACLLLLWYFFDRKQPFYGFSAKQFYWKPYFFMLLLMLPLIAAAATQPDFLAVYPKLENIAYLPQTPWSGAYKLLYELAYGSDFLSIELFFRGFLVLAFIKYAGKNALLPMAVFYCTIHFGKPLGECISSFFGGLILGIVTYHTRTIFGGLMVHLGIAWLMELGGYLGNHL